MPDYSSDAWFGGAILLFGLPFGWLTNGWAVYANLFFPFVIFRAYKGKAAPVAAGLMMLFLFSIVFFQEMLANEGGATQDIASWGWGAILWGCSLLLAAGASAWYAGWIGS